MMKQMGRWSRAWLAATMVILIVLLAGCGYGGNSGAKPPGSSASGPSQTEQKQQPSKAKEISQAPLTGFKEVSDYIRKNRKLPDNFVTKKEAEQLGWVPSKGNLNKVAPGKSIGGDRFGNREKQLPDAKNRIWYEADINYKEGPRNADRILYSSDGLIYMTNDHYKTFTDITKEGSVPK
ncbi:ribonuclease domain-containing protein [Paenibacillus filicis]|uniref:Ribonuclease n=1 Tax=Paenibacillus filicis TaxID=669464 RepID=A0ABU9DR65_9BACL